MQDDNFKYQEGGGVAKEGCFKHQQGGVVYIIMRPLGETMTKIGQDEKDMLTGHGSVVVRGNTTTSRSKVTDTMVQVYNDVYCVQ